MSTGTPSPNLEELRDRLSVEWPAIRKAQVAASDARRDLEERLMRYSSSDTSITVFGSVARLEVTSSSDLDWILLVDGSAVPEHEQQERGIEHALEDTRWPRPGKSGLFGKMVGSHDLVHKIGGEDDLNSNTTRRILLLFESWPASNREAYDRVRRQLLRRYLDDDRGLIYGRGSAVVPRFLLNDLTRYWRTVTVDFVYKQRAANDAKWALRNAKLRMSRKLVFASGLLHCFACEFDVTAAPARQALLSGARDLSLLTTYLEDQLSTPPLETVAKACRNLNIPDTTCRLIFDLYDRFLAILDDPEKRSKLQIAQSDEELRNSQAWIEVREVSRPFHQGLVSLFLKDNEKLSGLTMEYGIF